MQMQRQTFDSMSCAASGCYPSHVGSAKVDQLNRKLSAHTTPRCVVDLFRKHFGVQLIGGDNDGVTPLMVLIKHNNFALVRELLSTYGGVIASLFDTKGETAAHYAVRYLLDRDAKAMLELLISYGAPAAHVSSRGETPLNLARVLEQHETAAFLQRCTVEPTQVDLPPYGGCIVIEEDYMYLQEQN